MMTDSQKQILTRRYPIEGASDALCRDLGLQAWQVRYQARRMKVTVGAALIRNKRLRYTVGSSWEQR